MVSSLNGKGMQDIETQELALEALAQQKKKALHGEKIYLGFICLHAYMCMYVCECVKCV